MKLRLIIIMLILTALTVGNASAQTIHTRSQRALKFYDLGKRDYELLFYDRAENSLLEAVREDDRFYEAHLLLAQMYSDQGEWEKSVEHYRKAVSIDYLFFVPALFGLGKAEMRTGRYVDAREHLEAYLKNSGESSKLRPEAEKLIANCIFALSYSGTGVYAEPVNAGDSVNTLLDEYWPSVTGDGNELFFTRELRKAGKYGNERQEDFYISKWNGNGFWGKARNAGSPLNTAGNEGAQSISSDGRTMYFTACDRNDGQGRCDLYTSMFDGNRWSPGSNMGSPVNSTSWESQPSVSPNGKMLFFVSNRPGGQGGMDLWYTVTDSRGNWKTPENPGKMINTPGDEISPFIYFDGKTLYFSSNGRESFGGFDIYRTVMNKDSTWAQPVNLGPSVNTPADENGLIIESTGRKAYFSSTRDKAKGKDIFYIELPEAIRPDPVSYIRGTVTDRADGRIIQARVELTDLTNRNIVINSLTDSKGVFFVCLPAGVSYGLNVTAQGYMIYSENFDFEGGYTSSEPYLKTIGLNRVREGELMRMYNVFYNTDSWEILDESRPELENLVEFLRANGKVVVEIGGHTDSDGDDEHNQVLSEQRAHSVKDYLIKRGIGEKRLYSHGYGEKFPVADNITPAGKKLNRRTEIKILSSGTE